MSTRSTLAPLASLLAATIPFALLAAPSPDAAPANKAMPAAKQARSIHPDGSVSVMLERPGHGLIASVGADGRIRISCVEAEHALLDKRAHERLHHDDATAWE